MVSKQNYYLRFLHQVPRKRSIYILILSHDFCFAVCFSIGLYLQTEVLLPQQKYISNKFEEINKKLQKI